MEFVPKESIPAKKVLEFLKMDPPEEGSGSFNHQPPSKNKKLNRGGAFDGWQENNGRDEQTMVFGAGQNNNDDLENDLFTQKMLEWLET